MRFRHPSFSTIAALLVASLLPALQPQAVVAQNQASAEDVSNRTAGRTPMPSGAARTAPTYRIGPGDTLTVDVFDVPEMKRTARVREDGTVPLAPIGDLAVKGRTLGEAEALIEQRLAALDLVVEPQVTLSVAEYSSLAITILGAVGNAGTHQLTGSWTLLEMLGRAGGVEADAGRRILIQRANESNEKQTFLLDREKLLVSGNPALNVQLRPGDIVLVPRAESFPVYVGGAVAKPGVMLFDRDRGSTLLQALVAAGGSPGRKDGRRVTVLRSTAEGGREELTRDVEALWTGQAGDIELEPGDILVVGQD